ncbi:MAG TPA: type IV pilus biogenesis/stability protein PilW, partial [Burkholderiales bacterium]|nr:type IV pilus biogenesis/stability protein PilW [Burkholderiales bacterium]
MSLLAKGPVYGDRQQGGRRHHRPGIDGRSAYMTEVGGAMRIFRAAIITGCLAMAACATQPTEETGTQGSESQNRMRARVHTELAGGYYEIGNIGVALEEAKEAMSADPSYGPAHNIAGLVYSLLKEDRLAEQSFQRALAINSTDSDANNNYGEFLCQRKREEEAIKYFLTAVRNPLYPTPERSYVNAGVCARRAGDLTSAENYFQLALKTRPEQTQALYQMADLSYSRGDDNGARNYLGRLTRVSQVGPEVLWL